MRVLWLFGLLSCALSGPCAGQFLAQQTRGKEALEITHGPILGRIGAHEISVWARTSRPRAFRVHYGLRPGKLDRQSPPVLTRLEDDNAGYIRLTGLKSHTRYYYQVMPGDTDAAQAGPGGSFRTLPDADAVRNPEHNPKGLFNFSFEFACGNNQALIGGDPRLATYKTMLDKLRDKIDFAILNGDWLYEEKRDYSAREWMNQVNVGPGDLPRVVQLAPTIVGVWENYKVYLERGKRLAAWHREIPSFFTYDDHEILNDVYGTGSAGLRDRRTVFRDIAIKAWFDYLAWSNPVEHTQGIYLGRAQLTGGSDLLVDREANFSQRDFNQAANLHVHWGTPTAGVNDLALDGVGGDPNAGVYKIIEVLDDHRLRISPAAQQDGYSVYSIGRRSYGRLRVSNGEFFLLDTRGHRQMHDVRHPDKPGVSLLGQRQKAWLMDGMSKSDADFFFVVSSVNFMITHRSSGDPAGDSENKEEAWTGFLDEREQLIRFWDSLERPVFVLTGDLHNSFAIKITDRVWEFASGPHASANHPASAEGDRRANGVFDSLGRPCEIRWSSYFLDDTPLALRRSPIYCVVQVNNIFNSPVRDGQDRWVAFPRPQVIFQYYNGLSGDLLYAQPIIIKTDATSP